MWLRVIGALVGGVGCVVHGMRLNYPRIPGAPNPTAGWAFIAVGLVLLTLVASYVMIAARTKGDPKLARGEQASPAEGADKRLPAARVVRS